MTPEEIHDKIVKMIHDQGYGDAGYTMLSIEEGSTTDIPPGTYVFSRDGKWILETYCCPMRRYFLVGIVGTRANEEMPIESADFIDVWEPKMIVNIQLCRFCGQKVDGEHRRGEE
mgnify:CR=1 FL=1